MTADSASFAEIETTDAAPAADLPVADFSTVADLSTPAANDPSSDAAASEAPKAFADDTKPVDAFNDTAGNDDTFDAKSKRYALDKMAGENTIGEAGGGPMNQPSAEERQQKKEEEFDDLFDQIREQHAEQQRQEEHARKWDSEMHDIAGTQMSGHDFMEMREFQKSEQGRKKILETLQQKGMTEEQAKQAESKANQYYDLIEKMRNGQKLTEEEKKKYEELQKDKQVKEYTTTAREAAKNGHEIKSEKKYTEQLVANADLDVTRKSASVSPKEDTRILESRATFASAANLTEKFVDANNSKTPLDNPSFGKGVAAKPEVIAAVGKREVTAGMEL